MIAMEAVVRNEHHGSIRPGQVHQPLQKNIMQAVGAVHHVLVGFEIGCGNAGHFRRMIRHEGMRKFVNGSIVNRHEIPVGVTGQQMGGGGMDGKGFGQSFGEMPEARVLLLIHLGGVGDKEPDEVVGVDFIGADPQFVQGGGQEAGS